MAETRKTYTPEQRGRIVEKVRATHAEGFTIKDACAKHGIDTASYQRWRRGKAKKVKRFDIPLDVVDHTVALRVEGAPEAVAKFLASFRGGLNG